MMLVFLDACCLIYAVEDKALKGAAVRSAVLDLPRDSQLATTELVRFECIVHPLQHQDQATLNEYAELFSDCVFLQLGRREYDMAADLRAKFRLRALDAMHLAAAVAHGCNEFWTNDSKMIELKAIEETAIRRIP